MFTIPRHTNVIFLCNTGISRCTPAQMGIYRYHHQHVYKILSHNNNCESEQLHPTSETMYRVSKKRCTNLSAIKLQKLGLSNVCLKCLQNFASIHVSSKLPQNSLYKLEQEWWFNAQLIQFYQLKLLLNIRIKNVVNIYTKILPPNRIWNTLHFTITISRMLLD